MSTSHPSRLRDKNRAMKLTTMQGAILAIIIGASVGASLLIWGGLTNWTYGFSIAPPTPPTPPTAGVYDLSVIDTSDLSDLNNTNVSYWDAKSNGLPDDALVWGTPDNVSMLTYAFIAGDLYWAKAELSGYQTKWQVLNTTSNNVIKLLKLPTENSTGSIINSTGGTWYNNTSDEGTIRFVFDYTSQNGTGFEPYYNAFANTTTYLTLDFYANTTGISKSLITVTGEVVDDKDVNGAVLSIPVDVSFLCGESTSSNFITFAIDVSIGSAYEIYQVDLVYDGIVYGSIAVPDAP